MEGGEGPWLSRHAKPARATRMDLVVRSSGSVHVPPRNAVEGVDFKTYKCAKDFLAAYGDGTLLDGQGFYDPTIPGMREEFIKFVTTPQYTKGSGKLKYDPSKPISWFVVTNALPLLP